jgi:DNA-binding MarR family transcriptional regulator
MTIKHPNPVRDAILNRIGEQVSHVEPPAGAPLTWDDIGLLCHGLVFAQRPILAATKDVTERNSLGPRGAWLLNLISAGVNFPHELSEVMGIGRSLMSAELARLTDAGLIVSKPGATDKRRTELALTDKGEAEHKVIHAEIERILRAGLANYSPDEVRLVTRMLRDMRQSSGA